jgi:hypothetical protein
LKLNPAREAIADVWFVPEVKTARQIWYFYHRIDVIKDPVAIQNRSPADSTTTKEDESRTTFRSLCVMRVFQNSPEGRVEANRCRVVVGLVVANLRSFHEG